jgi:hypothetical protein
VMEPLDAHHGAGPAVGLPPAVASAVAAIHAERDAERFEVELARFLSDRDEPATSAS